MYTFVHSTMNFKEWKEFLKMNVDVNLSREIKPGSFTSFLGHICPKPTESVQDSGH